ncbi:hypothetical protein HPB52_009318 [Rhipicephalus sanguineus]|uniref:Uncharacterized protein n=1 Tax=Rhipicephalus sanguineus TaxID=34632 RepID=A0A9D4PZ24_RHISA|nr:hypothetical protein HPB52_009318 [Rhipicephalus sanguineus]
MGLTIRVHRSTCQKLPGGFGEVLENFKEFVVNKVEENEISRNHIFNLDEILLNLNYSTEGQQDNTAANKRV